MNGVLVVDKPAGPTSFEVVRQVRLALGAKKAGHTGTLDPLATGVLPVCLGEATKLAGLITLGEKAYDAVVRLGKETDTQDAQGRVLVEAKVPPLTAELLESTLAAFRGTISQTPPMFSAVKVAGRRLHELAREGTEVERAAREVTVFELVLRDFSQEELRLSVRCSKGFFVRTLAHELGRALGCGAHLGALRRTRSGPFVLSQAVTLDQLLDWARQGQEGQARIQAHLLGMSEALSELPAVTVSDSDVERVAHGVPIEVGGAAGLVRVVDQAGALLAIADAERGRLHYRRVLQKPAGG